MARPALAAGLALIVVLSAGCKRASPGSPAAKTRCRGELSSDELYRIQEALQRGEDLCPELAAPKIVLGKSGLTLDGEPVSGSLPTTTVARFQPLFDQLKSGRETWKMVHPGEEFRPTLRIVSDHDVSAVTGASIITTAAFAGYPKLELSSGDKQLSFEYALVRPPLDPEPPEPKPLFGRVETLGPDPQSAVDGWGVDRTISKDPPAMREELRLAARPGAKVNVRFVGRPTPRVGLDETVPATELGALLTKECKKTPGACADTLVVEVGAGSFHEAIVLAHTALQNPAFSARRPALAFEPPAPRVPKIADKSQPTEPAKRSKIKVRLGALSVSGPLEPKAIAQVLRDSEPAFRACYERGLESNPHLIGRIVTRFVIGRDGSVWAPSNAGSDLPDVRTVWCVMRVYRGLSFPKPADTTVTVVSPQMFSNE